MKIHREGHWYIVIATLLWLLLGYLSFNFLPAWLSYPLNIVFFLLWFWVIWFFRLPARQLSQGDKLIVAPADGKVVVIEETFEPEYFKDKRLQISIFMSPLNVHVNRSPIDGTVRYMKYHAGKFLVAWHPKSSTENERTTLVIENKNLTILLRQVAGAVARRICYYKKEAEPIKQNEEFGFIKFGSRVDIYLPLGTLVDVKINEIVQGGVSVLAHLP
ncbi:MAG: phosphatidylserine decarboxylase family protein [Bacteroidetes bacterium]|nr:phosphatidylserine decarboxylase family protein [Bacteroidota bacterium]